MLRVTSLLPRSLLLGSATPVIGKVLGTQYVLNSLASTQLQGQAAFKLIWNPARTGIGEGLGESPAFSSPRTVSGDKVGDVGIAGLGRALNASFEVWALTPRPRGP